jgi:hypothetical protein
MQWLCVGRPTHVVNSGVKSHSLFKFYSGRSYAFYAQQIQLFIYQSATKSGKAKSKSRYTDVHTILEEIDWKTETEIVVGRFSDSQVEKYFLRGHCCIHCV